MSGLRIPLCLILASLLTAGAFPAAAAAADAPERVIDRVSRRVVKIFGAGGIRGLHAYSTGFLVSPKGHLVTVWSHVLDDQSVTVVLHDGRRLEGKILGAEPQLDLAVLKIEGDDFPYFDLDDAISAPVGTRVLAYSNMFKVAAGDEPVSVLHGVIAARTKLSARKGSFETPYAGPVYVVDAITNNPGSGGGVLTTRDGTLVGMIGKELRNAQTNTWVNYAIPIGELKPVIGEIISGKFVAKSDHPEDAANPRRYAPVDFGIVLVPDVLYRTPAFVDSVIAGSPAEKAGIRPNDLVLFVNDELVQSCRMLREDLGRLEAGDTLKLVLRRGNALVPVEFPVEKKEEAAEGSKTKSTKDLE
ncbi:MAG TPA: trypsin-like peptidase domain-containing protein [Planctomycetaceae bacterium]|jgi:serine protease Do|nr:trypsin-like peptidase domain-containing protein [Planctomycetaceae bacterium]